MNWLGILLMAALLAVVPGYGRAQPQEKETPPPAAQPKGPEMKQAPAPSAAKSYTPKEKKEYQKKTAADLAALEKKIEGLMEEQAKAPQQLKRMIIRGRVDLQRKDIIAKNKLAALEKASGKDWNALKDGLDKAMEDLRKSYEAMAAHFQ